MSLPEFVTALVAQLLEEQLVFLTPGFGFIVHPPFLSVEAFQVCIEPWEVVSCTGEFGWNLLLECIDVVSKFVPIFLCVSGVTGF